MLEFLVGLLIVLFVITASTGAFYEVLYYSWNALPRLKIRPRLKILVLVLATFVGHFLAILIYGVVYYILLHFFDYGAIKGDYTDSFYSYLYFSVSIYSSLGIGDIYPTGNLRLVAGVEVLNGLALIGWSVSATFLAMERFWDKK